MNEIGFFKFLKDVKEESKEYSDDIQEVFPYFCLKIFFGELSKDDMEEALTGLQTNDDSIDAFVINEEMKELHFIQCKSAESIKAAKKEWLSYLNEIEKKLEDDNYIDAHKNSRIREIAEKYLSLHNEGYKVKKWFFHLGTITPNVRQHYENTIHYYGIDDIKEEYEEYRSKLDRTEPPSVDITIDMAHIEPPKNFSSHRTFISIITGDELVRLRQTHRYKLFDKNLRFSLGQNKINKKITETAIAEPENFYFFNNGITITSKSFKYQPTNTKLKIKYPQIINGAQTVNALYAAYNEKENKETRKSGNKEEGKKNAQKHFKRIKVLFRVIRDSEKDGKKNSDFENNVIRYNNSQNSVKESDFYANNEEQIKLQRLFAKLGYFYETKRGDRKYLESDRRVEHTLLKKKKGEFPYWGKKIDMESLASIWMAYSGTPVKNYVEKRNIFGYAQDKHYDKIFKSKELDEKLVKEMILACNLDEIIHSQMAMYGTTKKKGLIVSKISQFQREDEKAFGNIKEIIKGSLFLGDIIVEKYLKDGNTCYDNKEIIWEWIKKYQFFGQGGRYFTLAIFKQILDTCGYTPKIIEHKLFSDYNFIKNDIAKKWLKTILDDILWKSIEEFYREERASLETFYSKVDRWEKTQKRLEMLELEKNKPFQEIFPLTLS